MSSRRDCYLVLTILVVLASSCLAHPIDGPSPSHKEVHRAHEATSSVHSTTVAPHHHQTTTHRDHVPETTKKPEAASHKSHPGTLHPSVSEESVKVTTGSNDHETSHRTAHPETQVAPVNGFKIDLQDSIPVGPLPKLCDFLKPICNSTDKIVPKQLVKIQGQFKKIVQMSAGKLGFCFLDHYGFDPTLEPITKANLAILCNSKDLAPKLKNSYKSFETCAVSNWDPNVDLELGRFIAARANCTKNHNHVAKNEPSEIVLEHEDDEDELSLISDVVNKVFEDNKGQFANSSDVKFIDVSGPGFITTPKPLAVVPDGQSKHTTHIPATTSTNKTPLHHQAADPAASKSPHPPGATGGSITKPAVTTKGEPSKTIASTAPGHVSNKAEESQDKQPAPPVTDKKHPSGGNSTDGTEVKKVTPPKSLSSLISPTTTTQKPDVTGPPKEVDSIKTTVAPKTKITTTSPPPPTTTTTTLKPILETLEEVLRRQEKEKKELDDRLRLERERVIRQLQKKQDEIDAKNAIKALQLQRDASNTQNSDAKLHQLEHERQMSIDPIGHTIKHQQYEMNRQQKMMNGRV